MEFITIFKGIKIMKKSELRALIQECLVEEANKPVEGLQYAVVMQGGSIGEKRIDRYQDLNGIKVDSSTELFDKRADAMASAKEKTKRFSAGERKVYGLKYIAAGVVDGKFTGKKV
jgi:hypothetical protein